MSERDFEVIANYEETICNRGIDYKAHENIEKATKVYLAKGKKITILGPSDWQLDRKKRTSNDNTILFGIKKNATHH